MAGYNVFPATYNGGYYNPNYNTNPYQQMQYQPQYGQQMPQQAQGQNTAQQTAQTLTPPIIHTDIIQVPDVQDIYDYQQAVGVSQMYMTKDEKHIAIKTTYANSKPSIVFFDRQPEQTQESHDFDTSQFVTWEKLEKWMADHIQPVKASKEGEDK